MRRLSYGLCALLLLGMMSVVLAYAIPAAWLAQHLAQATDGRVQFANTRGLWHRGSGNLVLSSGAGGTDAAHWTQRLQWDVAPLRWPALWSLRVTWPEVGPPLSIALRADMSGWSAQIAPWEGVIPLGALAGLGTPFNTLALEGDAQLRVPELQRSSGRPIQSAAESPVEIHITRLRSALAPGVALGDYVLRARADGGGVRFTLRTTQGALLLEGSGQCGINDRRSCGFEGTARAARFDETSSLGNLLGLLGRQQVPTSGKNAITELRW